MKVLFERDFYNWTIGFAICRSKKTNRLCVMITLLCLGFMIMPGESKPKLL